MVPTADYWIKKLQLSRHIEGGSFRETYRSELSLSQNQLPKGFGGERNISTSIYFLLEQDQFSAFHRIASDEQWHFYYGGTLVVYEIQPDGFLIEHRLGGDPELEDEQFQCVIKAGSWFASKPAEGAAYSLTGCTVAPGFDFEDFKLADRAELINQFAEHEALITMLTRDKAIVSLK
jgi:predicted cupin superfamily sugar epimerase